MPLVSRPAVLALASFLVSVLIACGQQAAPPAESTRAPRVESGPPRAYRLGFSALPATLTDAGYEAAFDLAADYGEVLLIQRPPSWSDFLPGASVSATLRDATAAEREAARSRKLQLFVALDPFDPAARERLANLPGGHEGKDLGDSALRHAFVAEAKYIAVNYRPAYLALGMEVNATYERNPAQYARFVEAYREAYDAVKASSPETKVFVTFQYEQLLGVIPWEPAHAPRWELLEAYDRRLDAFAITTYPSFAYPVARRIPPEYYRQVQQRTTLPVLFAATGYSSGPSREGVNSSTPPEQRRYVQRLFADADQLRSPLVVWLIGRDPTYLTAPPYDLFASIGLRDAEDRPKEAWQAWTESVSRPYDPANAVAVTPTPEATGTPQP